MKESRNKVSHRKAFASGLSDSNGSGTPSLKIWLRRLFERVVEACLAAGLVGGEGFAVDASLIQADANK
jgi:hypothetical protein